MQSDPAQQARDMTVVVVGGGPTGVAISGSISELVRHTLAADFRSIDLRERARVVLVESGPRLLAAFSEQHSAYATEALERDGVEVRLGFPVTQVDAAGVTIGNERIEAATVLWCAGVQGVALARTLDAESKPNGTIVVDADLSVPGHPECFVVGDAACVVGPNGRPVPGLASIAQQHGRYVGKLIAARLAHGALPPPREPSAPGKLATVTRHVGVAEYGELSITGFPAWLMWGLLHLQMLSDGHSKRTIMADWLRLLMTYRRGSRLIIESSSPTDVSSLGARTGSDEDQKPVPPNVARPTARTTSGRKRASIRP
jgi:NADH:quinone reductase (non-electrogenic)